MTSRVGVKQDDARWVADRCLGRLPVREIEQSYRHSIGPVHVAVSGVKVGAEWRVRVILRVSSC